MKHITNPNIIYILTFSIPLLVYTLGWSTIFPTLSYNMVLFYGFTFLICIGMSFFMPSGKQKFQYHDVPVSANNTVVLIFLYVFYIADILYTGYIPLLAFSSGSINYGGSVDYGIPVIHVIAVTLNLFYALYVFHQFVSNRKKRLFIIYFLLLVPFVVLLQRSNIMYIVIGSFYIYILKVKVISFKRIVLTSFLALMTMFVFGYLGNLRSANGDSTFIPNSSGVTDEFLKSNVPNEFYWSYLYIGSPLANLQNNVYKSKESSTDYKSLMVNEFLPDFVSKRLSDELSLRSRAFEQINPFLNVGTIYSRPYNYAGWNGILLTFLYFIVLMNFYYVNICNSYIYNVTGFAMMFLVIALANFENTIQFSAYSFQLVYPLILSAIKKYKQKQVGNACATI